jgi:hypothetical protein
MKVELKNVEILARNSEETTCFAATVYIDGKKAGTVSNDGHGGCNRYEPWSMQKKLDEHAKTLPPWKSSVDDTMNPQDADILIGDLLDAHMLLKELRSALRTRVLSLRKDKPGVFQTKKLKPDEMARALKAYREKPPEYVKQTLNFLSEEEALKIYREAVRCQP